MLAHLSDQDTYKPTQSDTTLELTLRMNDYLHTQASLNILSAQQLLDLTTDPTTVHTQRFYALQKVHKPGIRPIVSA